MSAKTPLRTGFLAKASLIATFLLAPVVPASELVPAYRFDIPSQPASESLVTFAVQANLTLIVPLELVESVVTPALIGEYSLEQALAVLLAGTGLVPQLHDSGTLRIVRQVAAASPPAQAPASRDLYLEEVVVTGLKGAIRESLVLQRDADVLLKVITAEDVGKLPDDNVARALQRVAGVQISSRNGQGSEVQVRGFSQVAVELNGTSYVGTPSQRGFREAVRRNIGLEDIPAELVSRIEVVKTPSADRIEGALGATVDLRTRSPLALNRRLLAGTVKNTYNDIAGENDQAYSLFVGQQWNRRFGYVLNVSESSNITRNDSVRYERWDALRFDNGERLFVQDERGRVGVAVAPQLVELEQSTMTQDRLGATLNLQWQPSANATLWAETFYTEYRETIEANTMTLGLLDINRRARDPDFPPGDNGEAITTNIAMPLDRGFVEPVFGRYTPGSDLLGVDGEVTLASAGFTIPLDRPEGDGHRLGGQVGIRGVTNTNITLGGIWTFEDINLTAYLSRGESELDSIWTRQDLKGSYGNVNCAPGWREVRPPDPVTGLPVDCAQNLTFGYDINAGDAGSVFVDPALTGVNPGVEGGGDYLTDPYSYALGFASFWQDVFLAEQNAFAVDIDWPVNNGWVKNLEFGVRIAERRDRRRVKRGIGTHWRRECSLGIADLADEQQCLDAGGVFTDQRFGAEDANSLYVQPPQRGGLAVINDGSFLEGVDGSGLFPSRWLSGNPGAFAGDPLAALSDFYGFQAVPDLSQDYDIEETTRALYGKLNFAAAQRPVTGNVGLRVVDTGVKSTAYEINSGAVPDYLFDAIYRESDFSASTSTTDYTDILPSLNIKWEIGDDLLLRFAANRVVSRPDLQDLINATIVTNNNARNVLVGNPGLKPWRVNQADATIEWYFDELNGGLLSGAVFYKDIASFITERRDIVVTCSARGVVGECFGTQPINGEGRVTGAEFEYNQPLPLGFGLQFNYTYVDSETPDGTPVPDLSNNSANMIAYYENRGFGARVAYNWRDDRLSASQGFGGRPEFIEARGQLDISLDYAVNKHFSVALSATNLTQEGVNAYTQIEERTLFVEQHDRSLILAVRGRF